MQEIHMHRTPNSGAVPSSTVELRSVTDESPVADDLEFQRLIDEELAAPLGPDHTSVDDEKDGARIDDPSRKAPTFGPSTKMEAGKVKWDARFIMLPHALLIHETYTKLPSRAIKLLLAMLSQYVGTNNGHLTATFSRMKRFGFKSKDSLARSIEELILLGCIVRTRSQQRRMPALYALTWLPINKAPTGEPYDPGIGPEDESSDLWRHADLSAAKRAGVLH